MNEFHMESLLNELNVNNYFQRNGWTGKINKSKKKKKTEKQIKWHTHLYIGQMGEKKLLDVMIGFLSGDVSLGWKFLW